MFSFLLALHCSSQVIGARLCSLELASRVAVAKLRLDGTPTPRSLGGSDDEAASTNRCRQERLPSWRPDREAGPRPTTFPGTTPTTVSRSFRPIRGTGG